MTEEFQIGDRVFIAVSGGYSYLSGTIKCFNDDNYCTVELDLDSQIVQYQGKQYCKKIKEVFKDELAAKVYRALNIFEASLRFGSLLDVYMGEFDQETIDYIFDNYPEKLI